MVGCSSASVGPQDPYASNIEYNEVDSPIEGFTTGTLGFEIHFNSNPDIEYYVTMPLKNGEFDSEQSGQVDTNTDYYCGVVTEINVDNYNNRAVIYCGENDEYDDMEFILNEDLSVNVNIIKEE